MHHFEALGVGGLALDGHHVHVFLEPRIDEHVHDVVRPVGCQDVRLRHRDDVIGFADVPLIVAAELARRRHIRRITHRRARIHPLGNGGDLLVGQRGIVLELRDADVLVDVPRRHLTIGHPLPNRSRPGPHVLVRQQRHRRDRTGTMAGLTRALQDGRHILREGRLGLNLPRILAERRELDHADCQASEQRRNGRARKPGAEELPHDHLTSPRLRYPLQIWASSREFSTRNRPPVNHRGIYARGNGPRSKDL